MTLAISSAIPNDLSRYSSVGSRLNAELVSESSYLASVLQHFEATCREAGCTERVSYLADALRSYARQTELLDRWVGVVGIGFFVADSGQKIIRVAEFAVGAVLVKSISISGNYLRISFEWVKIFGLKPSTVRTFFGIAARSIRFDNLLKYSDKVIGKAALVLGIVIKWADDFQHYTGRELLSALAVDAVFIVIVAKVAAGVGGFILGLVSSPGIVVAAVAVAVALGAAVVLDLLFENLGIRDWAISGLSTAIDFIMDRARELPELGAKAVQALDDKVFMPVAGKIAAGVDNLTNFVDSAAQRLRQKLQDTADAAGRVISDKAIKPTSGEALELRQSLHDAMDGWGTKENVIFSLLAMASDAERQAILGDGALMERLRQELDRSDFEKVRLYLIPEDEFARIAFANEPTFPKKDYIEQGIRYKEINGDLFNPGSDELAVHPNDIRQGSLGDCYLMAALAELALQHPGLIESMITANQDGTYTVRMYDEKEGQYVEVRVDNVFPTDAGTPFYAQISDDGHELWPMIIEKAYAQYFGPDSYGSIEGGLAGLAIQRLSGGQYVSYYDSDQSGLSFDAFTNHFVDGDAIAVGGATKNELGIFQRHAYYVVAVDRENRTVTIRNPWGYKYEPIVMTWEQFLEVFGVVYISGLPTQER